MKDNVKTVVPNVPTWAVYYDEDKDEIFTVPVLWFESRYNDKEEGFDLFEAVAFSPEDMQERSCRVSNFLGLSLTEKVDRKDWKPKEKA